MLLSKKEYRSWQEIQFEYYDSFKTSLEFSTADELESYLEADFENDDRPFTTKEIADFIISNDIVIKSCTQK